MELFEGPISSMFGDIRPDCIVVCIPDALGDLRVQNPELSAKERRALEILKREEENLQGDLFAPTEEELGGGGGAPHDRRRPALPLVLSRAEGEGAQV